MAKDRNKIFNEICNKVIEEKISFNKAIGESDITLATFYHWITDSEEFEKLYNYAREVRSDTLFEEIVDISDESDDFQKDRLRIDARKWVVAKMQPKKYGDKIELEHSGGVVLHFDKDDEKA